MHRVDLQIDIYYLQNMERSLMSVHQEEVDSFKQNRFKDQHMEVSHLQDLGILGQLLEQQRK